MLAVKGSALVEYGLLIAGIVLALLLAINNLGQQMSDLAGLIQTQGSGGRTEDGGSGRPGH